VKRAEAEYMGGPADGQRDHIPVGPNGTPPTWLAYLQTDTRATVVSRHPATVVHRYEREPGFAPGQPWRYHHRGAFA
jgi:hypothetical protein